mmetsp:Transcript_10762/g.28378  ORF Transcript_10762/g.28378 Transcript_10762/m.28378 type:complete len:250 (-) Transcript_10762:29-778(-)
MQPGLGSVRVQRRSQRRGLLVVVRVSNSLQPVRVPPERPPVVPQGDRRVPVLPRLLRLGHIHDRVLLRRSCDLRLIAFYHGSDEGVVRARASFGNAERRRRLGGLELLLRFSCLSSFSRGSLLSRVLHQSLGIMFAVIFITFLAVDLPRQLVPLPQPCVLLAQLSDLVASVVGLVLPRQHAREVGVRRRWAGGLGLAGHGFSAVVCSLRRLARRGGDPAWDCLVCAAEGFSRRLARRTATAMQLPSLLY